MKKMPTIFKWKGVRESHKWEILNEINPLCQWVFDGEGVARQKLDGTCCMIKDGVFYKRRMVKKDRIAPEGFIFCDLDENTGKQFG